MNSTNQKGDITAENSKSIVIESGRDDDYQQEELKESVVQRDNYVKNSDKSKRSFMDLLNNSTVSIMPVFPPHISQSGSNQKLNKEDLGGDIYYDNEQIGRTSRKEQQDSNRVLDQDENPPNYETPKLKSIVIKQFFFRFKWVISIIAAIIISTGIGVGIWSHYSGSNEPLNPPALFSKTNEPYTTDYVKKGNITFRTIKATPLVVDPISNKNIILFPITKEMFFLAINNPLLTELPMSFELNEVANYTGTATSKTESDVLVVNKDKNELVMHFNISFYTLQITPDHYQIVTHYMLTGTGNDSLPQPTVQPTSQNASEQAMISHADSLFSSGSGQNVQVRKLEFEKMENASDEDKIAYLKQMIKISICNVTREGIIDECNFQNGMSFADKSLAVKFLKLYVPDLKKSLYQNNKGKLRFLQELALNVPQNGEAQYSLSSPNAPAVVMQSSQSQSEDDFMASKSTSTSSHELDLDKGKVSDVKKDESLSMTPTKTKGAFNKNETTVNSMDQQANVFINFVSHEVLSKEEIQEKYSMLSGFDFDTIKDPQSFFSNRKPTPLPINRTEMDDGQDLEMILSQGRNLASNNSPYPFIDIILGKMNLLIVTIVGGFGFACSSDDICSTGIYLDIAPIVKMWPISKSIQANIGQTVREYRYYKMVFQKNIDLFYDLSQQIKAIIEDLIFGNLDNFSNSFQTLLTPMINAEAAIANYTESVLSKTVQYQNSIDFSKTISNVIDQYTSRSLEGFLGQAKSSINFLTKGYKQIIDKFTDEISQTESAFNASIITLITIKMEKILGVYDQTLDQFDQSINFLHTDMMQKFDFVSFQVQSVSDSTDLTDFGYQDIINSIENIVKNLFTVLLQPIRQAFSELKNKFRVIIHLYHAEMRESLTEQFDEIIDQIKEQAGNAELSVNQIQLLDVIQYELITQKISFKSVILDITENTGDLFSSLQGKILSDILGAGLIIKEIATDENGFFNKTFTNLKKDIDAVNGTLILTIGQKINNTIQNASSRFAFVQKDIAAIPGNVISLFSQPVNLNLPIGKIDLNQEMNDIKALIQKVDDVMHDFTDLAKFTVKIDSRINDIQTRALNVLQFPERIKATLTEAFSKIKAAGDSIEQSFKLPLNGFSFTNVSFDALKNSLINQIRTKVIDYGKLRLKDLAKIYGGSFIVTLSGILDRKIAAITPASGKRIMYNKQYDKDVTLFETNIPLAIGSLYTQIFQSFNAGVQIFFEYVGGKLQIVVDPRAKFLFGLRLAWDLVIAKTGLEMNGTIFDVTIFTTAGFQLISLTPKAFINSALQISALTLSFSLVYCYLWPRIYWQCWYIGRRRCRFRLQWSSWMVIQSYNQVIGTRYTKILLNQEYTLKLM